MRIDTMGKTASYQTPQQASQSTVKEAVKQTGTESKIETKAKIKNTASENAKINNVEQEISTEERKLRSEHEVISAIEKANKHIKTFDRRLEFSIHEVTKQIMVKVVNTEDDTVIREIPSEKVLDMVAHMWEVAGILVDEKR